MTIKLIATDLDGTFLDERGLYDKDRFAVLLDRLDVLGIPFVAATGNSIDRIEKIFGDLFPRISLVAENGAYVSKQGQVLKHTLLDKDDVVAFLEYFEDKLVDYRVMLRGDMGAYVKSGVTFDVTNHAIAPEELELFFAGMERLDIFDDILDQDRIVKVTMLTDEEKCPDILADFNANFTGNLTAVTSGYGTIDIMQTGVHKGAGLQTLLDSFAISQNDSLAFGDGDNDVEMLALVGHSYAMANGSARVKACARYQAPANSEQGVFEVIERYLGEMEKTDEN